MNTIRECDSLRVPKLLHGTLEKTNLLKVHNPLPRKNRTPPYNRRPPGIERHPQEIDSLDIIERHANQFCTYSVYYCTYSRDIGQTD